MKFGYIILAYISLISLSLIDNGRSASYSFILKDFAIETSLGSLIFTLASATGVVANLTAKWWLRWLGLINSTRVSLIIISISSYFFYYSAKINYFHGFLTSSAIVGFGLGILAITMNVMVSEGALDHNRRNYLSGLHGVYGLSSLLAPLILNFMISRYFAWYEFFLVVGIVTLGSLIYSFFVIDEHREELDSQKSENISLVRKILVGFFLGCYVTGEILISSRLSYYLSTNNGLSVNDANQYLSLFFFLLMLGRVCFAFIKTDKKSEVLMTASLILSMISFIAGFFFHPCFLSFTGLTMSVFFPLTISWIKDSFKNESHSIIAFAMSSIGFLLSLCHWGVGVIAQAFSIKVAFSIYVIFIGMSLIAFTITQKRSI